MKKHLLYLSAAAALLLAGCKKNEGPRYDYPNIDITIKVVNSNGENLCYTSVGYESVLFDDPKIFYGGKVYELDKVDLRVRAAEPDLPDFDWNGRKPFRWNGRRDDGAALLFGEFSIDTKEYRGETFEIDWDDDNDGKSVLSFDLYPTDGKNYVQAIRVDSGIGAGTVGVPNSLIITIVKD